MLRFDKRHLRSLLVVCSAAVLIVIGSTVAYFSSKDEASNRFVGSQFDILLTETKWDPKAAREVIPGDELEKNPQVTNIEQTDGYIFLRVTVPCDTQMVDQDDGTPLGTVSASVPMYKFMVQDGEIWAVDQSFTSTQVVHSNWKAVSGYPVYKADEQQYVYVYAYCNGSSLRPLKNDETTEPLFDKLQLWNFNESYDPARSHSVRIEALGIQADLPGYSASQISDIWAILDRREGG